MESRRRLSNPQVLALRVAAQSLQRPRRAGPADVVRRVVGVQAQDRFAAPLAIRARSPGATAAAVDAALLEQRSVVRTWAMRGTLHFVAAEDLPWLVPLAAASQLRGAAGRLARLGVPAERADRAVDAVEGMLATDGPVTRGEIASRLRRLRVPEQGQAVIHLIRLAALRGAVCYGPDRGGDETFVLVRDWLGPADRTGDPGDSLAELAVRYLAAHGPAGPEDFAAWSGLSAADVRRAWAGIGDRLVEVATPGGPAWRLRRGPSRATRAVVRLVPAFDPFMLGWRTRELSVPNRHEREVFPGGGMLRPAVLADGVAVGTWSVARRGDPRAVTIRPFGRPAAAVRAAAEADAADVVRFLHPGARTEIRWE